MLYLNVLPNGSRPLTSQNLIQSVKTPRVSTDPLCDNKMVFLHAKVGSNRSINVASIQVLTKPEMGFETCAVVPKSDF
jgi:hypothetical protein